MYTHIHAVSSTTHLWWTVKWHSSLTPYLLSWNFEREPGQREIMCWSRRRCPLSVLFQIHEYCNKTLLEYRCKPKKPSIFLNHDILLTVLPAQFKSNHETKLLTGACFVVGCKLFYTLSSGYIDSELHFLVVFSNLGPPAHTIPNMHSVCADAPKKWHQKKWLGSCNERPSVRDHNKQTKFAQKSLLYWQLGNFKSATFRKQERKL